MTTQTEAVGFSFEVPEKARRRRFNAEFKQRILREADACTKAGELGALLRREGLYSSHLAAWRAAVRDRGQKGLDPQKRGPQPRPPELAGMFGWEGSGREWSAVSCLPPAAAESAAQTWGAQVVEERAPSLDRIFVARVGRRQEATVEG